MSTIDNNDVKKKPEMGDNFSTLKGKVSEETLKSIENMGFNKMTICQHEVIPTALVGEDIVCTAQTGAGKTLAFLIPAIEIIKRTNNRNGVTVIVISPTRELAIQTFNVLEILIEGCSIKQSLLIGGESRSHQVDVLKQGVDIIVSTPGRLLDLMKTREFKYKTLKCLIIDEADKILQYGFEEELAQIIMRLPKLRQTMLFSATESEQTESLTKLALKESVEFIHVHKDSIEATVDGLKHGYVVCELKDRLWWLFKMIKKIRKQKVMVFFSSCKAVKFYYELFKTHCRAPVICIHGKLEQSMRTSVAQDFYNKNSDVILFCTDVAARGLDFPAVDWIVQFDPPHDVNEYIHRVGRTARGIGSNGNGVLLLRSDELQFLRHLKEAKVFLEPYEIWTPNDEIQIMVEKIIAEDEEMNKLATDAFEGFLRAYQVRKEKTIFNIMSLDMTEVAKSFGFTAPPKVDFSLGFKKKHRTRKRDLANELQQHESKLIKIQ